MCEEKLDKLILQALTNRLLTPKRTQGIVAAVAKRREGGRSEASHTLNQLRGQLGQVKEALKPITVEQSKIASKKLKQLILDAPADLKKRYIRAFVSEIVVGKSEIILEGPTDALAEAISGEPLAHLAAAAGPVRSLVRSGGPGGIRTPDLAVMSRQL